MTLKDIKDRCEANNLKYQYGIVEDKTSPPYVVAVVQDSNNFVADNKVYKKIQAIELYYTYKVKSVETEELIENTILDGVVWRKGDEEYFYDSNVWQVIYYFNIQKDKYKCQKYIIKPLTKGNGSYE